MYVYMYVYIHIYIYIYTHVCVYIYIYIHTYIYIYMYRAQISQFELVSLLKLYNKVPCRAVRGNSILVNSTLLLLLIPVYCNIMQCNDTSYLTIFTMLYQQKL